MSGVIAKSESKGFRRKRFGRLRGRNANAKVQNLNSKVNKISKTLMMDQQINAFDQDYAAAVSTTGSVQEISNPDQGNNFFQRTGNQINIKSLSWKLAINKSSASTVNQLCRFMIVKDKSSNGAIPSILDVLTAASVTETLDYTNKDRFHVYVDRLYALSVNGTTVIVDKGYLKFKRDLKTTFIGTGATPGNLGTEQLYVVMLTDQIANGPTFQWNTRIKYIP